MEWWGFQMGGLLAWQYSHHDFNWITYLILIGVSVLSMIARAANGGWRGDRTSGAGWNSSGGWSMWTGNTMDATTRFLNPLQQGPRLTPPPMSGPAQSAADRYQRLLNDWMGARGLDPSNVEHVRLALVANPYTPETLEPAALAAGPSSSSSPARLYPPQQVQELLWLYGQPWWVAGGWALDLWQGRPTRPHQDVEIAIPRADQLALRSFMSQFRFMQATGRPGGALLPLATDELVEPPRHELHAQRVTGAGQEVLPLLQLEVLLNDIEGGVWRYRRDQRVSLPLDRLGGTTQDGIPYLAPEIVLLYKAGLWQDGGMVSSKDDADFRTALPQLPAPTRYWLREAIATAHPGHPWLLELNTPVFGG